MTVSIPRQLLRPTGALVATILISTAAILYYVHYSIADLRQRLPLETVEHQRDLVITIGDLLALREAVIVARATPSAASFQKIPGRVRTLQANLETSHRHAEYLPLLDGMEISAAIRTLVRDVELWLREGALGYPPNSPYVLNLIDARVADTYRRVLEHFAESSDSAFNLLERKTAALERFGAGIVPAVIFVSLLALILVGYVVRQRHSEAAARAAQQRLCDAIDSISGGLALFDSGERLVLCNPRYADLFPGARDKVAPGRTFEEMLWVAARWGEILNVPSDQVEDWVARRLELFRNPGKRLEVALADGRWFRVAERRTADGGTVVISSDITESRRRERQLQGITEELRHKNVLLDAALDNMVQGLAMFDNEKRLIICNQRYLDIYDLPRDLSEPGTPLKRIMEVSAELQDLSPDETEVLVERRLAIAEQPFEVRQQEFLTGGSVIDILHRPMPRGCSLATYEDATDRHKTEVALRAAKEDADLANRTKSEFLANMSHELRTPLNAIIGFSEIIKSELFGPMGFPQYGEYASDIYDSGTHLLSLINDILDISKIEAGKFELQEECVNVNEAIVTSLRLIRERAEAAGIRVIQDLSESLPSLNADLRALKQILLNLLSNAVKFTAVGGSVAVALTPFGQHRRPGAPCARGGGHRRGHVGGGETQGPDPLRPGRFIAQPEARGYRSGASAVQAPGGAARWRPGAGKRTRCRDHGQPALPGAPRPARPPVRRSGRRVLVRDEENYACFGKTLGKGRRRWAVGNQGIDIGEVTDLDRRLNVEFGMVRDHDDLIGLADHRAGELGLAQMEVHETVIQVDRGDGEDRAAHPEPLDEFGRRGAKDRTVVGAVFPTCQIHTVAVAGRQRVRDIRAVRHHHEVGMAGQRARHVGRGATGIQHHGIAIAKLRGRQARDRLLGLRVAVEPLLKPRFAEQVRQEHAAMDAFDQALVGHDLDVSPDGFAGNRELIREPGHRAGAVQAKGLHDRGLARGLVQGGILLPGGPAALQGGGRGGVLIQWTV